MIVIQIYNEQDTFLHSEPFSCSAIKCDVISFCEQSIERNCLSSFSLSCLKKHFSKVFVRRFGGGGGSIQLKQQSSKFNGIASPAFRNVLRGFWEHVYFISMASVNKNQLESSTYLKYLSVTFLSGGNVRVCNNVCA